MEPRRKLGSEAEKFRPDVNAGPRAYYESAKTFALEFYPDEVSRIASIKLEDVTPDFFFKEYVWVVHATGFSAGAVGKFIGKLGEAYGPWSHLASETMDDMMPRVAKVCNNPAKAKSVHAVAKLMAAGIISDGWDVWRRDRLSTTTKLAELPYVGKVTCFHLGRNIGLLDCVKPDLHLVRLADQWGFATCEEMCDNMRGNDDVPLGIVDLYLWYAASTFGTTDLRKEGGR